MNDKLKYAAGALLFALWAGVVIYLKQDPADLIGTIKLGLLAIFGYAGVTKLQAAPQPAEIVPPVEAPKPVAVRAPTVPLSEGM